MADGYPINFFIGESVPDRDIGFILAWLYKSADILILKQKTMPPGIVDTNARADKWGFNKAQEKIEFYYKQKMS